MPQHPFKKKYFELQSARIEFRFFKCKAPPKIEEIKKRLPKFSVLENLYSYYLDEQRVEALQLSFGVRPSGRMSKDGKAIAEGRGVLLYTLGPDGRVAVAIYPTQSESWKPFEDHIYLRIGRFSGNQLLDRLEKDIRDFIAYTYVTAIDGSPTLQQRFRIWWLRRTHPMQVEGKYQNPSMFQYAGKAAEFTFRSMILALLKPIAIVVVVAFLLIMGYKDIADFLKPSDK